MVSISHSCIVYKLYTFVNKTGRSFWNQKRTTGNINHNQCTFADSSDSKPFCFTTELGEQWEHCNCKACNLPFQTSTTQTTTEGSPTFGTATPSTDASSTSARFEIFRPPTPIHPLTGTRFRDVPEQIPQIDKRSQYDQNGKCLKNCKSQNYFYKIYGESSKD